MARILVFNCNNALSKLFSSLSNCYSVATMAIKYPVAPGTLLLCDYALGGFKEPEMVKRRPVIVISPRLRHRDHLCTVVPLSSKPSFAAVDYVVNWIFHGHFLRRSTIKLFGQNVICWQQFVCPLGPFSNSTGLIWQATVHHSQIARSRFAAGTTRHLVCFGNQAFPALT